MIGFGVTAVLISIFAIAFIFSTAAYIYKNTAIPKGIQNELYISRMFSYAGCLAYQDPNTQRTYPYVIERAKFTDERLRDCLRFPLTRDDLCYELRLYRFVPGDEALKEEELGVIHSNNYDTSCLAGANIEASRRPVTIIDSGRREPGAMTITEFSKK
jgi:hypothetical protein